MEPSRFVAAVALSVAIVSGCSLSAGVETSTSTLPPPPSTTVQDTPEVTVPEVTVPADTTGETVLLESGNRSYWAVCLLDALVTAEAPVGEWFHANTLVVLEGDARTTIAWDSLSEYLVDAVVACPGLPASADIASWPTPQATAQATTVFTAASLQATADHTHPQAGLLTGELLEVATAARDCLVRELELRNWDVMALLHPVRPVAVNGAAAAEIDVPFTTCLPEIGEYVAAVTTSEDLLPSDG